MLHKDEIFERYTEEDRAQWTEKEQLADDALNVAVRHIQDALGVESGDQAAYFFSGHEGGTLLSVLEKYIESELFFKNEEEGGQHED